MASPPPPPGADVGVDDGELDRIVERQMQFISACGGRGGLEVKKRKKGGNKDCFVNVLFFPPSFLFFFFRHHYWKHSPNQCMIFFSFFVNFPFPFLHIPFKDSNIE
jgi:hypothetical protein